MRIPAWLFALGIILVIIATVGLSVTAYSVARQIAIDAGNAGIQFTSFDLAAVPTATRVAVVATPLPAVTAALGTTAQPTLVVPTATLDPAAQYVWSDPRRITLLLLGIDQRSALDDPGPFRTDTMIVVSIDPVRKTAGVLSIPRDLWVNIPGFQPGRINTANMLGDVNGYPGGGPALAAETVRQVLGIPIDRYVLINFDVFLTIVNTLAPNGVEVCVRERIDDPNYPDAANGFIRVTFEPGCQVLDAERLLQYARTRHGNTDFARAERQQEVLRAVRETLLNLGGVTQFIGQAPALWTALSSNIKTNLSLDDILRLGTLVAEIPRENFRFGVIDNLYVNLAKTSSGDDVLVLRANAVSLLLQQVFYPEENLTLSDLRSRAEAENASIVVFNNTDVAGLAGQTRDWLSSQGVSVAEVGNTPTATNEGTTIRVYTGKLWTGKYLAALMGLPPERVEPGADGLTDNDVAVVVGPDIQPLLSGQ